MPTVVFETYHSNYLEAMLSLYNAETAHEPHIAVLQPDQFIAIIERKTYFDPSTVLIAREGANVLGWVHACVTPGSESWHDQDKQAAQIRMLIFSRTHLDIGALLVREATALLEQRGNTTQLGIHAQVGYPFYRGLWMGGEPMGLTQIPQIQMALEVGGYKNTQESIFMVATLTAIPQAQASVPIELIEAPATMQHPTQRESWLGFQPMRTRAILNGEEVGSIGWVVIPHVAAKLGAPCMNIWGLGVAEAQRRKGIAAALIANALRSAYTQGARFASVGTQLWNAPAHATYARFGFVPVQILIGRTRTTQL